MRHDLNAHKSPITPELLKVKVKKYQSTILGIAGHRLHMDCID